MPIKIERDWFFPKSMDGNLSLSTQEERINQALASMQPGDWLEVDGIRCCSRNEILAAIGAPGIQSPVGNPNPQAAPIVCPNCGANTTNRKNCEYCGSMLVRFVDKNIAIDQNVFGKNALSFSSVVMHLKKNLELQNELSSTDVVRTEFIISNDSFVEEPYLCVYGGNISETKYAFYFSEGFQLGDANIPPSSEPRLLLCFATPLSDDYKNIFKRSCHAILFSSADIPAYDGEGRIIEYKKKSEKRDLYYLDMGQDYENAAKIITDLYQKVYGVSEDLLEIKTEQLSLEQQRNAETSFPSNSGCSVALLPMLGIGAGIAAGIVKLISHLLV